jgi:integrase
MALGMQLMDEAERLESPMQRARTYRDGLLIAMLAARPIRRHSLSTLKVGINLLLTGNIYVLSVDSVNTKSGHAVEYPLPDTMPHYISRYLAEHRRRFPQADRHDRLWPSTKGGPLAGEAIYDIICRRTLEAFGFSIHPHLFRDIAATALAREAPDSILLARDLLTHASIDTTSRHYTQSSTLEAARVHGVTLDALRQVHGAKAGR